LIKLVNDLRDQIFRFRRILLKMDNMARTSMRTTATCWRPSGREMLTGSKTGEGAYCKGKKIVLKALEEKPNEL